jgi:hypothetical protein
MERYAAEQTVNDSMEWASRSSDSSGHSSDGAQEGGDGGDDGMWYQYKYEEQFETLKKLGIDTVRVQNKRYVRFIDKHKKVWTLIDKEGAFYDDGMVLFHVDKKPIHLYLNDFGSNDIREYFRDK